uniref:Gnk2-homologous domain-containing protein n=1 Tax=Kalanchoe fedtschenkoi TaxID=63787 RepID=A0A7N0TJ27_KALFE
MSGSTSLCILSLALVLQTVFGASPLYHFCTSNSNFTARSPYESSLNKLIATLSVKTPPTGFAKASKGQNSQDTAYGSSLCRGDVSKEDCKTCVVEAGGEIRKRCEYNKGATIWYDNCMFKYTDQNFFGQIDYNLRVYMWNVNNVSDPTTFNAKTKKLLSKLAQEAYEVEKLYAVGETKLDKSTKLYGLTQCTRDLSSADCKTCLENAIAELPNCCDGKEGGRVLAGSCNFRYEIYPFVNA